MKFTSFEGTNHFIYFSIRDYQEFTKLEGEDNPDAGGDSPGSGGGTHYRFQ